MADRILIIDDDRLMRNSIEETLKRVGYEIAAAPNGQEGVNQFKEKAFNLVLCDMKMPGMGGIEVLEKIKEADDAVPFIIVTAYGSVSTAVEAMQKGAVDFIEKPFKSLDELEIKVARAVEISRIREENKILKKQLRKKFEYIGKSRVIKEVDGLVKSVAEARSTVLVTGESGTGKELVARAIHINSPRNGKPFIKVNCAALPENLIESELFGHKKGAFTGALKDTKGKFELASGGTLLLDEVGEMPLNMQSKLLRVLQEREIDKIGDERPIEIDVRIIVTTNRDLKTEINKGTFREDLYYRLNVVPIHLAPLRERKEDIPLLVEHFINRFNEENGFNAEGINQEALKKLSNHDWPGNIRELENTVERAVVLQKTGTLSNDSFIFTVQPSHNESGGGGVEAGQTIAQMERMLIYKTLEACKNNRTRTAEKLGISIRTLRNKLQEYEGKKVEVLEE